MTTLDQIVYENGHHWVKKLAPGRYEVYRNTITHAVRCSQVSYSGDDPKALRKAIAECDRREQA